MSTQELQSLVERLRAEREALEGDFGPHHERLDALAADLEHRLEHPREDNQDEDLLERLREGVEHFEVEHPRVTGILNDLMVALSSMGI